MSQEKDPNTNQNLNVGEARQKARERREKILSKAKEDLDKTAKEHFERRSAQLAGSGGEISKLEKEREKSDEELRKEGLL